MFLLLFLQTIPVLPLYVHATAIDLMLTTSPELVKNCQVIPPIGTFDQNGIFSVVSLVTHTATPQVFFR